MEVLMFDLHKRVFWGNCQQKSGCLFGIIIDLSTKTTLK